MSLLLLMLASGRVDFVRDAGDEAAQGRHLLGLDQLALGVEQRLLLLGESLLELPGVVFSSSSMRRTSVTSRQIR